MFVHKSYVDDSVSYNNIQDKATNKNTNLIRFVCIGFTCNFPKGFAEAHCCKKHTHETILEIREKREREKKRKREREEEES